MLLFIYIFYSTITKNDNQIHTEDADSYLLDLTVFKYFLFLVDILRRPSQKQLFLFYPNMSYKSCKVLLIIKIETSSLIKSVCY